MTAANTGTTLAITLQQAVKSFSFDVSHGRKDFRERIDKDQPIVARSRQVLGSGSRLPLCWFRAMRKLQ
jgi:hypothetical protein